MPLIRNLISDLAGGNNSQRPNYYNQGQSQYPNQYPSQYPPQGIYSQYPNPAYNQSFARPAGLCGAHLGQPCSCSRCSYPGQATACYMPMTKRERRRYQRAERHAWEAERLSMGGRRQRGGLLGLATAIGSAIGSTTSRPQGSGSSTSRDLPPMTTTTMQGGERDLARRASFDVDSRSDEEDLPPAYTRTPSVVARRSVEVLVPERSESKRTQQKGR